MQNLRNDWDQKHEDKDMKVMLTAFVAIIIIAAGANYGLKHIGFSSQDRNSGADVRVGES